MVVKRGDDAQELWFGGVDAACGLVQGRLTYGEVPDAAILTAPPTLREPAQKTRAATAVGDAFCEAVSHYFNTTAHPRTCSVSLFAFHTVAAQFRG